MSNRDIFWATVIGILVILALWINLSADHPQWVNSFLVWQPEESKAYNRSSGNDPLRIRQGLDLQGGVQVLLQAVPVEGDAESQAEAEAQLTASIETARNIIERRVNGLGVAEALVQTQGDDRIVVELPGIDDPDLAVGTIKETGLMEFIDTGPNPLPTGLQVRTTLGELTATPALTDTDALTCNWAGLPNHTRLCRARYCIRNGFHRPRPETGIPNTKPNHWTILCCV